MSWDEIEGHWNNWTERVAGRWGKLSQNDLILIGGSRNRLIRFLQERYGQSCVQLEREVEEFCSTQGEAAAN